MVDGRSGKAIERVAGSMVGTILMELDKEKMDAVQTHVEMFFGRCPVTGLACTVACEARRPVHFLRLPQTLSPVNQC